jgi:hypothetical protein
MNDIKASPAYVGRFQRVCRYIARHLDEPLSLETLSAIAHSSPYHFYRHSIVPVYSVVASATRLLAPGVQPPR